MVRFEGEGSGEDELSWGQRELWQAMEVGDTWLPLGEIIPLPEGTTVAEVAESLRFWMDRFQPLRTRLRFGGPQGPRQVVASSGEVTLEVVDTGVGEDPVKVAEQVKRRFFDTEYDFEVDWPVRMAVVRHRGVPTHQVLVLCHLASDAAGGQVMFADLAGRDPVTGAAGAPPPRMQPLAQARWQRSPAGHRQSERAIAFLARIAREMPSRRFGDATERRDPRHWELRFSSPALYLAVRAVAARTRSDTSPVLLTSLALAQARVSGVDPAAILVLANNRFRPELADVVGPHGQVGLLVVDVAGLPFDEALARTRKRAMAAYKYAYYDPRRREEIRALISRERGEELDLFNCYFNDRRADVLQGSETQATPVPTPAQVRAAPPLAITYIEPNHDGPYEKLFFHIEDDTLGSIAIRVQADTHHIALADVERIAREMEAVTVAAAVGGHTAADVPGGEES